MKLPIAGRTCRLNKQVAASSVKVSQKCMLLRPEAAHSGDTDFFASPSDLSTGVLYHIVATHASL